MRRLPENPPFFYVKKENDLLYFFQYWHQWRVIKLTSVAKKVGEAKLMNLPETARNHGPRMFFFIWQKTQENKF